MCELIGEYEEFAFGGCPACGNDEYYVIKNAGKCDCGEYFLWMKTYKGASIPVDIAGIKDFMPRLFNNRVHTPHFVTCPNADKHRQKKGAIKNG